jgi:hypothetical protein
MAERIAEYKKKYLHEGIGTAEAFDKEVAETIINTYVDINSGEMYPGGGASDDGNVRDAAKEYMGFWRDIIKRAKDYGVLEKEFGEGGITVERNVLTSEMANMSAEDFAKAVQEGTLEKTKVVALGHIARRYNSFNITADISNFRGILARNIHMNDQKLTPDEIDKVINNMIAKLINKDVKVRSAAFDDLPFGVKFTKEREIAISDEVLSKGGYLNYNIVGQELGSWRGLVAETELNRAARNIGFENWSDLKKIYEKAATEKVGEVHSKVAQKREIYRKIKLKVRSL